MTRKEIETWVTKWLESQDPNTFIKSDDPTEEYWYTSKDGRSSINVGFFMEELLEDFLEEQRSAHKKSFRLPGAGSIPG